MNDYDELGYPAAPTSVHRTEARHDEYQQRHQELFPCRHDKPLYVPPRPPRAPRVVFGEGPGNWERLKEERRRFG